MTTEERCCIDDVAHAWPEPEDGRALYLHCRKHGRREKLADNYYPAPSQPSGRRRGPSAELSERAEAGEPSGQPIAEPIDPAPEREPLYIPLTVATVDGTRRSSGAGTCPHCGEIFVVNIVGPVDGQIIPTNHVCAERPSVDPPTEAKEQGSVSSEIADELSRNGPALERVDRAVCFRVVASIQR